MPTDTNRPVGPGASDDPATRLESWKEIAAYLQRDVRTVMRWEHTRTLPVHRVPGGPRAPVFALRAEIDAWLVTAPGARDEEPDGGPLASAAPAAPGPSIAVLPLVNMTSDVENDYVADGLADEILTLLARVPGLRVAARTSSFAFRGREGDVREIGARLGVAAVLEGSLRKAGDRLRITVQLISALDGYHLWADRFDRPSDDIFAIQDEIAEGVVASLKIQLNAARSAPAARRPHPSQEAYHQYLKGRYLFNRRSLGDMQRSLACFEHAASLEPAFAPAHVGIADIFATLGLWELMPPRVAYARVKAAASRALEIDDSLGAAHVALATAHMFSDWDWERARSHFERARGVQGPPSGPIGIGFYHVIVGRADEALRDIHASVDADPLSAIVRTQAAALHVGIGDYEAAATLLESSLELDSELPMTLYWLGCCRGIEGRLEESATLLHRAAERGLVMALAVLTRVFVKAGDMDRARAVAARLEHAAAGRHVPHLAIALAHAALGRQAECVELLERAAADRSPMLTLAVFGPGYLAMFPPWLRTWIDGKRREIGPKA